MSGKLMSYDVVISQVDNGHVAGTSAIQTGALDMQDATGGGAFDGVIYIVSLGTVTSGCVLTAQAQDCATSGGSYANVGTAATVTDSGGATSNSLLIVDVANQQKRYSELALTRAIQNAVVNCIIAIRYRGKRPPVTQDATVSAIAQSNATS